MISLAIANYKQIIFLKCIWHEISYFLKWKNSLSCSVTYFSVSCFYVLFPRYFNLFDKPNPESNQDQTKDLKWFDSRLGHWKINFSASVWTTFGHKLLFPDCWRATNIIDIQLFQLRLSTSKAEKSNTSAKGWWEPLWKFINLLVIPSSLSRSYSTFPLCSWTTLIEITVYPVPGKRSQQRKQSFRNISQSKVVTINGLPHLFSIWWRWSRALSDV
jgi:hypothetical protein